MKSWLILPIFLEAAGPDKKEYLKTASCHVKGFAKAAGVDSFYLLMSSYNFKQLSETH
jgi:hypothetical protein